MTDVLKKLDEALDAEFEEVKDAHSAPLPVLYYDPRKKDYYLGDSRGRYVCVNQSAAVTAIVNAGFSIKVPKGEELSEADIVLLRVQREHNLDFVGGLAGHRIGLVDDGTRRLLITSQANFITPSPGTWDLIRQVLDNLFGPVQINYVFGWLKISLAMYICGIWQPGQAFCMCGPAAAGKNLVRQLFTTLLGGRFQDPWQYMTGETSFNSELFSAECLAIEDKAESYDIRARRAFGAAIKNITVNRDQRFHRKGEEAFDLNPLWRLFISLNNDPENLGVLPPIDSSIEDKVMLFKVERHPMPMPTKTPHQYKAFGEALTAELPAFAHFLQFEWEIPDHLVSNRFGITHYHHPDLIHALGDLAPEKELLDLIDDEIQPHYLDGQVWSGKASDLLRELTDDHSCCANEARRLLKHSSTKCGQYLGRLQRIHPERIESKIVTGHTVWTVKACPTRLGDLQTDKKALLAEQRRLKEAARRRGLVADNKILNAPLPPD